MDRSQLGECAPVTVGNAAYAPCVKPLGRQLERLPNKLAADRVDEGVFGVGFCDSHKPKYQHSVYIARGQTFIGRAAALMHKLSVANDPAFGERLRQLIPLAGFKNPRRFALDGMQWDPGSGPQRLNGYLKGRIPDVETLVAMATVLQVTVSDLLGLGDPSAASDDALTGILRHLLELEGIEPAKADTIANVSLAAQRLFQAFPDEEPLPTRAKFAARAAWLQQHPPTPGR